MKTIPENEIKKLRLTRKVKSDIGEPLNLGVKPKATVSPEEKQVQTNEQLAQAILAAVEVCMGSIKALNQAVLAMKPNVPVIRPEIKVSPAEVVLPEPAKEWKFTIKDDHYGQKTITGKKVA